VLVDAIQECRHAVGVVVNPAAFTHTSVAIRDALAMVDGPVVEVHLSNPQARESFRGRSHVSGVVTAVIAGCGPLGYEHAGRTVAALGDAAMGGRGASRVRRT
jgi:3-dehydroquinate dehydratase-2